MRDGADSTDDYLAEWANPTLKPSMVIFRKPLKHGRRRWIRNMTAKNWLPLWPVVAVLFSEFFGFVANGRVFAVIRPEPDHFWRKISVVFRRMP